MDKDNAKTELRILLGRYNNLKVEKETDITSKEEEKTKTRAGELNNWCKMVFILLLLF